MHKTNEDMAHTYETKAEVFQLRFSGGENNSEISAWELAQALEGVAGFAEDMAKTGLFGEGIPQLSKKGIRHENS